MPRDSAWQWASIKPALIFKAIDNLPVRIIFLLTGPEDQPGMHIRLLSRLSRLISQPDLRELIVNSHSSGEVYQHLLSAEQHLTIAQ